MTAVSVIVPVYNVEKQLERCLDSIIAQTFTDMEIILVDDGSEDLSGALCDRYASMDARIKVIHRKYGGVSAARNTGVSAATGRYIAFVDSDDYIPENMLERLYCAVEDNAADMSVCGFVYEDINGKRYGEKILEKGIIDSNEYWRRMYEENYIAYVTLWAKMFRRELWEGIQFPVGKYHEDEFVWQVILDNDIRAAVLSEPMYCYFQRPGSIVNSGYLMRNLDAIDALFVRCSYFVDKGRYDLAEKTMERILYKTATDAVRCEKTNSTQHRIRLIKKQCRTLFLSLFPKLSIRTRIKGMLFCISPGVFRFMSSAK